MESFSDCSDSLEVYYNGPLEYTDQPIYGYYVRQEDLIHGRPWFKNNFLSIWWDEKYWRLGNTTRKGERRSFAKFHNDGRCLPKIYDQKWNIWDGNNWNDAENKINVQCGHKPEGIV